MEVRGGDMGRHYGSDDHCPACGTGLLSGESCGIPGCPRYGKRAMDAAPSAAVRGRRMEVPEEDPLTAYERANERQQAAADYFEAFEERRRDAELFQIYLRSVGHARG